MWLLNSFQLDDQRKIKVTDFTMCTRFKTKILGTYKGEPGRLWTIADHVDSPEEVKMKLFVALIAQKPI